MYWDWTTKQKTANVVIAFLSKFDREVQCRSHGGRQGREAEVLWSAECGRSADVCSDVMMVWRGMVGDSGEDSRCYLLL
jgi:hypothetical protein